MEMCIQLHIFILDFIVLVKKTQRLMYFIIKTRRKFQVMKRTHRNQYEINWTRWYKLCITFRNRFCFRCALLDPFFNEIIVLHCTRSSVSTKRKTLWVINALLRSESRSVTEKHGPSPLKCILFKICDCLWSQDPNSENSSFQNSKMQWSHGSPRKRNATPIFWGISQKSGVILG